MNDFYNIEIPHSLLWNFEEQSRSISPSFRTSFQRPRLTMDLDTRITADATIGVSNKGYQSHGFGAGIAVKNADRFNEDNSIHNSFSLLEVIESSAGDGGSGLS